MKLVATRYRIYAKANKYNLGIEATHETKTREMLFLYSILGEFYSYYNLSKDKMFS